ncbi:hypothetical protein BGZ68_003385, partial [Mortierella alpina]
MEYQQGPRPYYPHNRHQEQQEQQQQQQQQRHHYHGHYYPHRPSHAASDHGRNSSSESLQALEDLSAVAAAATAAVASPASFAGYDSDSVLMTVADSETVPRGQPAHPRFQAQSPRQPQPLGAAVEMDSGETTGTDREAGHIVHACDADDAHSMVASKGKSNSGNGTHPALRFEEGARAPSTPEVSTDPDSDTRGSDPCSGRKNSISAHD